ncbi:Protein NAR1, partial [Cucurbita argyrosperma subsp. argyrosperma]
MNYRSSIFLIFLILSLTGCVIDPLMCNCSGCVTSAETVMLEKQSLDEFLSNINKGKVVIVSLSPQSRASLAVHFGISPLKVFQKLTTFFKSMGVKAIFDTSCSRDLTLIEACNEFIARYRKSQLENEEKCKSSIPMISSACPVSSPSKVLYLLVLVPLFILCSGLILHVRGEFDDVTVKSGKLVNVVFSRVNWAMSRYRKCRVLDEGFMYQRRCSSMDSGQTTNGVIGDKKVQQKPILEMRKEMEGWICYAEKQHGSYILPYISSVKSPQQMIGSIVKHHMCQKLGIRSDDVYHVTVMPCYDKKLEAAREDFVFQSDSIKKTREENEAHKITEVDSVLTSGEVLELIQMKEVDFKSLEESPLDRILTNVNEEGHLFGVRGSSGGYAETIFRHAAKLLFGKEIEGPLEFKPIRNSDFQELTLEVDGKTLLKFALCYGFRNLQNVVRKIKTGKCDYHFLEIMACPSGCLNGGGQIKPKPGQSPKDLIELLEAAYQENVLIKDPFENPMVKDIYKEWLEEAGSEKAKKHMHTEYHPVVKSITAQLHNW